MSLAKILIGLECIGIALCIILSVAHKQEILAFKPSFGGFALSMLVVGVSGVIGFVLLLMALFGPPGFIGLKALSAVLGLSPLLLIFLSIGKQGFTVPRIHNISTTPEAQLEFVHAQGLRRAGDNSLAPPSREVVEKQKLRYPELQPLAVMEVPQESFAQAIEAARHLGWQIHYEDRDSLRFEAIDETKLFGFKDDVLVVVTSISEEEGIGNAAASLIHVRSVSRVGVSDLGANAKRIKRFYDVLKSQDE